MEYKNSFKCALVTGATSGLGEAMAHFLAKKNIDLILTGRNTDTLSIDLTDKIQRGKLLEVISAKVPDLIINSAGFGLYGPTVDLSIEEQLQMIEVNVAALVEISIHSAKELLKAGKKGTILNISSASAFFNFPTFNIYCASKRFVTQFSLTLDAELRDKGIRVLCACPGQIATPFRHRAGRGHPQKHRFPTMSMQQAVRHLWKQIQREKPLYIFDWRTKVMVWASKLIPQTLLENILKASIKDRWK